MIRRPPRSTLFPTRRSSDLNDVIHLGIEEHFQDGLVKSQDLGNAARGVKPDIRDLEIILDNREFFVVVRSEEHTSELQSHLNLVCRLLLEKKKKQTRASTVT